MRVALFYYVEREKIRFMDSIKYKLSAGEVKLDFLNFFRTKNPFPLAFLTHKLLTNIGIYPRFPLIRFLVKYRWYLPFPSLKI